MVYNFNVSNILSSWLVLMWKYMNWKTWVKVVITVAIALIVIGNMGKSPSTNNSNNSNEVKTNRVLQK